MRYSFISAAVLAFVSAVSAAQPTADFDPMTVPSSATDSVKAGSDYTIKWTAPSKYSGTVTISLLEGPSTGTLSLAPTPIDTGIVNSLNEYTWSIPADIEVFAFYGIQISYDNDPTIFQWSFPFHITGSSATTGSSTSTGGSTSTKTVTLATGTGYSASSTSSSVKVSSSSSAFHNATTVLTVTSSSATAASNATLSTSATLTSSQTTSSSASRTSGPASTTSSGAAVANMVKGSFAVIGGAVLAFAL